MPGTPRVTKRLNRIHLMPPKPRSQERTTAGGLPQPPLKVGRVPRGVPDGEDCDFSNVGVDREVHRVWPRRWDPGFLTQPGYQSKPLRVAGKRQQEGAKVLNESDAEAGLMLLLPVNGIAPFPPCLGIDDDLVDHLLASRRSLISAKTCSTGTPRPGCCSASSARRSSSAACSAVSSSSNRSRSRSKTSRCSSTGSLSTCRMTSAALMAAIYGRPATGQAGFPLPARPACSQFRSPPPAFV